MRAKRRKARAKLTPKLTAKQELFVHEYLIDLNGRQAAIRAGYQPGSAAQSAYTNLRNRAIQALIAKLVGQRHENADESADREIRELESIAFSDIADYLDYDNAAVTLRELAQLDRMARAAIESVEISYGADGSPRKRLKLRDKVRALELLGKYKGLFVDRVRHSLELPMVIRSHEGKPHEG